jgi:hypothetical protein
MDERLRLVVRTQPVLPNWPETVGVRTAGRQNVISIRSPVGVLLENASNFEHDNRFGWTRCVVWAMVFEAALVIAGLLCWGLSLEPRSAAAAKSVWALLASC